MKKLDKPIEKEYHTVIIYYEELKKVAEILETINNGQFFIRTEDYEFNDIDEFKKRYINQNLNYLEIGIKNPYIKITFTKFRVRLYCVSDNEIDSGIFYKLDKILSPTTRKPKIIYSFSFSLFIGFVLIPLNLLIKNKVYSLFSVAFEILLFFWYGWILYLNLYKSSDIRVKSKNEVQKFFSKNRDIFLVMFSVLLTSILDHFNSIYIFFKNLLH